jgi:hypothetical protein
MKNKFNNYIVINIKFKNKKNNYDYEIHINPNPLFTYYSNFYLFNKYF